MGECGLSTLVIHIHTHSDKMTSTKTAILVCLFAAIGGGMAVCLPGYTAVGDKCYSVPGLPQRYNFYMSTELCSLAQGDLFHVNNITQWTALNEFLVDTLGYTDTYWSGVAAEGHPGQWVIRASGFELKPEAVEFKAGAPSGNPANLCLAIEYQTALRRYQWVDYPCSNTYVVVCEPKCLAGSQP